jgi:hypothetical protein
LKSRCQATFLSRPFPWRIALRDSLFKTKSAKAKKWAVHRACFSDLRVSIAGWAERRDFSGIRILPKPFNKVTNGQDIVTALNMTKVVQDLWEAMAERVGF